MAKPEWGTKRKCLKCDTFFYDMRKKDFTCPKCAAAFEAAAYQEEQAKAILKNAKKEKDENQEEADDDLLVVVGNDEMFGEGPDPALDVLEDASELGDDNHDMAEVIDGVDVGSKEE